jgi:hypothetical protein
MSRVRKGRKMGEDHPKTVLTDQQVSAMRRTRETMQLFYAELGRMFACSKWTAADICQYKTRIG